MTVAPPMLWVLAGPNGAGKSTYHAQFIAGVLKAPFVNADHMAVELWGRHPVDDAETLQAAQAAATLRRELMARRRSFVAETVFSHESKLDLMREAIGQGFVVRLTYVSVDSPDLCVLRVQQRVAEGGHDVPVDKITARYARSLANARRAVALAHFTTVLDNTSIAEPHRLVLRYEQGALRERAKRLPSWTRGFPGLPPTRR